MRPLIQKHERGQAMVEFALAITILIVLLMGVFDLGRGIFEYNGVSQAAREIARTTSVHPGIALGASQQTATTIAVQRGLLPAMQNPTFECVDIDGSAVVASTCPSGMYVRVTVTAVYKPALILGIGGTTITLKSVSSIQIPRSKGTS